MPACRRRVEVLMTLFPRVVSGHEGASRPNSRLCAAPPTGSPHHPAPRRHCWLCRHQLLCAPAGTAATFTPGAMGGLHH